MSYHESVLLREVIELLQPKAGGRYLDATAGGGGHSEALLEASAPDGEVLSMDCDAEAIVAAKARLKKFGARSHVVQGNYRNMKGSAGKLGWETVHGVLFDLGVSSHQLDSAARGFSFAQSGPLDMRMDTRQEQTAAMLLAEVSEEELRRILEIFGQERRSRLIARAIVRARARQKLATTADLAEIISERWKEKRGGTHPAARTFQALRMVVNNELDNVARGLEAAVELLCQGGRVAVLSFHSGEDLLVKQFFRRLSGVCVCPPKFPICGCHPVQRLGRITSRALIPSPAEITANPRARSAKLRVAEKIQ